MKIYQGGCHCGAIRYEVETDLSETLLCNCSHCEKKGFILNFVDQDKFKLTQGEDKLTSYQFNKKAIDHVFCSVCGTQSFSQGITFPKVAINVRCLDGIDITSLSPQTFNGRDI